MRTDVNPLVSRSPFGGQLVEEQVPGVTSGQLNPENNVDVGAGGDRTMYVYVPASGCPHPKQTKVLMVLRDDASCQSAQGLLDSLGLADLAEEGHFVVIFPNPLPGGWNYDLDSGREDDAAFIVRCFAALPKSRGGVAGFNGMICHLATTPASSAMAASLALTRPLDAAALMVGSFPEGYVLPKAEPAQQVAWVYETNPQFEEWVAKVGGVVPQVAPASDVECLASEDEPWVALRRSNAGLSAEVLRLAWETMFEDVRRWRNDTYGIFAPRPDFAALGVVAHMGETSLGLTDGLPRTWYEYVPEGLRDSEEPLPLVFYLHGINCCGLYGAEQSGWLELADRDGLAVVFPDASVEDRWNVWDDPRLPSDVAFIEALVEHMDRTYGIDRRRVYVSGFSMGSAMTNALASVRPELFAGAIALNGPHFGGLMTLDDQLPMLMAMNPRSTVGELPGSDAAKSPVRQCANQKRRTNAGLRMPLVQFAGLCDSLGMPTDHMWPLVEGDKSQWVGTVSYWLDYDASGELGFGAQAPSGFVADECERVEPRFAVQGWTSSDEGSPVYYRFVTVDRLEHAVDPRELELGWEYVRCWAREADGSLVWLL